MTNTSSPLIASKAIEKRIRKRHAADLRFKCYGIAAIAVSFFFLGFLLVSIISSGYSAFWETRISLPITFSEEVLAPEGNRDPETLASANYNTLIYNSLKSLFPEVLDDRQQQRKLYDLISNSASYDLQKMVLANPGVIGTTQDISLLASSDIDMLIKGKISRDTEEARRKVKDNQIRWVDSLTQGGRLSSHFNTTFFTQGDSRNPEQAGFWGSIVGSFFTILSCMLFAFPIAVLTAVYLEEFAPKNRLTDLIEVNLNNLAAVPSIVFGLLGLSIFLAVFGMPRSASLVGGITLSLMVLPTIVITTRNAIKAVPPSIRDGALALGASRIQVIVHHTIPLAMPGIMTGTILSIARALGETAPLLMIGMVAFVADIPSGFLSPATAMPVQIFLWADSPELGFVERTSAGIMILLLFLIIANAFAIYLRKKFEIKW